MPVFNEQTGRWERDAPYFYDHQAEQDRRRKYWDENPYIAIKDIDAWVGRGNDPELARKAGTPGLRRGVDAQGRPWSDYGAVTGLGGRGFEYLNPSQYQGQSAVPEDTSSWYRTAPKWNQQKGKWENPLDWTNIGSAATAVALTAGGANAFMAGAPAVAGAPAAPAAAPTAGGGLAGLTAAPVAPAGYSGGGGGAMTFGRRAWNALSSDEASAAGKVLDWGTDYIGGRRAEGVLADDKAAADLRYQAQLDLLATQRTEDLRLDAERETRLQARWDAQQAQRQAIWEAREAQMEPYRVAGQQSLARVANLQTPTLTPYRSRFMA